MRDDYPFSSVHLATVALGYTDCNLQHRTGTFDARTTLRTELLMKLQRFFVVSVIALLVLPLFAADQPAGVLSSEDVKSVAPASYFYRGQSASVQMRNSAGIRTKDQKYILAGLVDTSGYAADIAQKYQGLFITEVKIHVEGSDLAPGEYGFGFTGDKFVITDVGANDVLSVDSKHEDGLKRPVPLKIVEESGAYRLYAGRKYVTLRLE